MNTKLLFVLAILLYTINIQAQHDLEISATIGALNYQGDFAESPVSIDQSHLAIGFGVHQQFNPKVSARFGMLFGKISGDYSNVSSSRFWTFERQIAEITLMGEWHPFGKARLTEDGLVSSKISPFIALGTGLAFGANKIDLPEENVENFVFEEQSEAFIILPIAIGARAYLSESFSIAGEFSTRFTLSDHLDGVSQNGNPDANDWYVFGGISIRYLIKSF